MNELSLFSGSGGGLLGSILMGWRSVGYVEQNKYCQQVIRQRIHDGMLHDAPIYGDIDTFIHEGYAESYKGLVDVVTAGFPCQPFSIAGKMEGKNDPRNKWPVTLQVIKIIRPEYAFLENVSGILVSGYFGTILRELAEIGYNAKWTVLSAADCGAPHLRKRLWILAYDDSKRCKKQRCGITDEAKNPGIELPGQNMADTTGWNAGEHYAQPEKRQTQKSGKSTGRTNVADTTRQLRKWSGNIWETRRSEFTISSSKIPDANKQHEDGSGFHSDVLSQQQAAELPGSKKDVADSYNSEAKRQRKHSREVLSNSESKGSCLGGSQEWWTVEPGMGRVVDGMANRMDRLKALGNGQVPIVAATAWRILKTAC